MTERAKGRLTFSVSHPCEIKLKRTHWLVGLEAQDGKGVAIVFGDDESNVRRFVACWNACEGISTASLEQIHPQHIYVQDDRRAVAEQRDELVAMLREAGDYLKHAGCVDVAETLSLESRIESLLAKYPKVPQ